MTIFQISCNSVIKTIYTQQYCTAHCPEIRLLSAFQYFPYVSTCKWKKNFQFLHGWISNLSKDLCFLTFSMCKCIANNITTDLFIRLSKSSSLSVSVSRSMNARFYVFRQQIYASHFGPLTPKKIRRKDTGRTLQNQINPGCCCYEGIKHEPQPVRWFDLTTHYQSGS